MTGSPELCLPVLLFLASLFLPGGDKEGRGGGLPPSSSACDFVSSRNDIPLLLWVTHG